MKYIDSQLSSFRSYISSLRLYPCVFIAVLLVGVSCRSRVEAPKSPDKKMELYILAGQSNMAGRGEITPDLKDLSQPQVLALNKQLQWQPARHPLHFDKPGISGVGPGLSFGIEMAKTNSSVNIGLIPCAVGGTSIEKWTEGAYDEATNTHPYDDAVVRIREAMKHGMVKGIIWHQGESNSGTSSLQDYPQKLEDLLKKLRALTGNNKLPVVIGELGQYKSNYRAFNLMLKQMPERVENLAIAASEGLVDKGDGTHFDGPSAHEFGKRFAARMKQLQGVK
jgi:hypothetical protein